MSKTATPEISALGAHLAGRGARRALAPIGALLLGELLALGLLAPPRPAELGMVPLALALAVLLAGLLPALLRPSAAASIVGCSAVVVASILWRPALAFGGARSLAEVAAMLGRNDARLVLLNMALLPPLTLHLAARFPERGALAGRALAGAYALAAGLALAACVLPPALRLAPLVALVIAALAGFGGAAYLLLCTIRGAQPTQPRAVQQARLLLLVLTLAEAPLLLMPLGRSISLLIPYEVALSAQILLPIGIAYIVMRRDLFGIDTAMRRALDYAIVLFALLMIYFGLTALLTRFSSGLGGAWGAAATILSVIATAAAFTPLFHAVQRLVDRVFYPERLRFARAIGAARAALAQVVQRDAVIRLLADELPRQLEAAWAELVLQPSPGQPAAASQPGVWSAPMTVGGRLIGRYWLGPRHSGLHFAADEHEQLASLVQQAALALAYAETYDSLARLNDELEQRVALRTSHVVAQQRELAAIEERQALARDLHDSVKQALFSLGIGLRTARIRLHADPAAAAVLLEQYEQVALQAQAELGHLLGHLRTPAAGTADLALLLAEHAAALAERHGLAVALELPPALVLPQPLPSALAQVAREALHNVVRHSGAGAAQLCLAAAPDRLTLTIADHGRGFDMAAPTRGHGLQSMRERVALLGGTLTVESAPGKGTAVCAQLALKP